MAGSGTYDLTAQRAALKDVIREEATLKLLQSLDDEQLRMALCPFSRPLIVQAGPGAGKTRALTARACAMVAGGAPPSSIFFLSFSRTAARECAERLAGTLGAARAARVRVRTFHGSALYACHRAPALAAGFLMEGAGVAAPAFPLERFSVIGEEAGRALFFLAMLRVNHRLAQGRAAATRAATAAGAPPAPRKAAVLLPTSAGTAKMEAMLRGDEPLRMLANASGGAAPELAAFDVSPEGVLHAAPQSTLKFCLEQMHRDLRKFGDMWRFARYWGLHLGHLRGAAAKEAEAAEARGEPARANTTLSILADIAANFCTFCLQLGVIELTDALRCGTRILETDEKARAWVRGTARAVLCDEFQDLNALQWRFLCGVTRAAGSPPVELALDGGGGGGGGEEGAGARGVSITVVGDAKQSIMQFQGAFSTIREHFFAAFPQPHSVSLVNNYRSSSSIVGAFNALMGGAGAALGAPSVATRALGEPVRVVMARTLECEAQFIVNTICDLVHGGGLRYSDCAVLLRSNRAVNQLALVFRHLGVPYTRSGVSAHNLKPLRNLAVALRAVAMTGGEEEEQGAVLALLRAHGADLARAVEGEVHAAKKQLGAGGDRGGAAAQEEQEGEEEEGGGGGWRRRRGGARKAAEHPGPAAAGGARRLGRRSRGGRRRRGACKGGEGARKGGGARRAGRGREAAQGRGRRGRAVGGCGPPHRRAG